MKIKEVIKTKIDINFSDCIVDVFVYKSFIIIKSRVEQELEREVEDDDATGKQFEEMRNAFIKELTKDMPQILFSKKFDVSECCNFIIIDNKRYLIPEFFNRKTVIEKDQKTWEMIFYFFFRDEINKKIKKLLKERDLNLIEKLEEKGASLFV